MNETRYFRVNNKTLANALNYCGFSYYKMGDKNEEIYSFEYNDDFKEALTLLNNIRKKNNKYK